jgi:hypothetical protein
VQGIDEALMKMRLTVSLTMALLAIGTIGAVQQDQKATFETTKTRMIALHASLISAASPPVRSKISASSEAARRYLAGCARRCDLHSFLTKDLRGRFTRLSSRELDLLIGLVFAETVTRDSELLEIKLQELQAKRDLVFATLTKMLQESHETQMSVVSNIKP